MSRTCRLLICNLLFAWLLSGCSTPGSRAREHAAALRRLSPADRQLVLGGHIHPGLDAQAVYIAWGSPDEKTTGIGGKDTRETWIYRQKVTLYEPMNSYYYYGPYQGFGSDGIGRGFLPGYAYGGIGYEGALRSQPHVRSLESVRIAEFAGGKVDRYKNADGTWSQKPLHAAAATPVPAVNLAAHHPARRSAHPVRHSVAGTSLRHTNHHPNHTVAANGIHKRSHAHPAAPKKKSVSGIAASHGAKAVGGQHVSTTTPPGHHVCHAGPAHSGASGHARARTV